MTQPRDLRVIWSAEVTRDTAEVTHPKPVEVTPDASEVTPGTPEVTEPPRGQVARRALAIAPHEEDKGAGVPTTFTTVECRKDDPDVALARDRGVRAQGEGARGEGASPDPRRCRPAVRLRPRCTGWAPGGEQRSAGTPRTMGPRGPRGQKQSP